jgi:hypothetical protein
MKSNRLLHFVIVSIVLGSLAGCAAILGGGSTTSVKFDSDPPGAKVYDDGSMIGVTPTQATVSKKKDHTFEFRKEGYSSMTRVVSSSAGAGWIVCDIFLTGLVGVVIDAATGSWNGLDNDFVKVALEATKAN